MGPVTIAGILLTSAFWFGLWALVWDKSDNLNVLVKVFLFLLTGGSVYFLYHHQFSGTPLIVWFVAAGAASLYLGILWKSKDVLNILLKTVWYAGAGSAAVFLIQTV